MGTEGTEADHWGVDEPVVFWSSKVVSLLCSFMLSVVFSMAPQYSAVAVMLSSAQAQGMSLLVQDTNALR